VLLATLIGAAVGCLLTFPAALLQYWAKDWRNGVLVARGQPPIKDRVYHPLWHLGAVLGAAGGALAGWLGAGPIACGLAGLTMPVLHLAATVFALLQARA
jgi:hypothetical protein